jgi:mannose-6-phosphate isomerase-like protein (cupin superfamily)
LFALKIVSLEDAISKVKELAKSKLAEGLNVDEVLEIGDADGFKIYVTAGKTVDVPYPFHENPKDVFMLIIEGEIEFLFQNGKRTIAKAGECLVLRKNLKHQCIFKNLTIALEGVFEKEL